ncbi:MAG: TrbG/VirB9 family P-type conjugative transfer protein [Rhizobiaceae bacterium]
MKYLIITTMAALLAFSTIANAEVLPKPGKADARVRFVTASANNVVKVRVSMRYLTTFEFGKGERIKSYALGDSESFLHEKSKTEKFLLIKSLVPGAGTNLLVYTDRNTYLFELVTGRSSDPKIYRVKVEPLYNKTAISGRKGYTPPVKGPVSSSYTKYYAAGSGRFKPLSVWDDGVNTFIRFKSGSRRPAIFKTNFRGRDTSTNSAQVSTNVVQVEGVNRAWTLRIGAETICILRGPHTKSQLARVNSHIATSRTTTTGGS